MMDSSQFMLIFNSYREIGAFQEMIDLYNRCPNKDFTEAPLVQELLGVAYTELNPPQSEKAIEISDKLISGKHSAEITGRAYDVKGRALRSLADHAAEPEKTELLKQAASVNETGFKKTLDTSLGLSALHRNIELGNKEQAQALSEIVFLAALRDGAGQLRTAQVDLEKVKEGEKPEKVWLAQHSEHDFVLLSTALQAALIAGKGDKEIALLTERLKTFPAKKYELDDLKKSLSEIQKSFPSDQMTAVLEIVSHKQEFNAISTELKQALKEGKDTKAIEQRLAKFDAHDYELNGLINDLDWIKQSKSSEKTDEEIAKDPSISAINAVIAGIKEQKKRTPETQKSNNQEKLDALYASTYSYRGLASDFEGASVVSGNMKFGGQLPEHSVAKKDLDLFSGLLEFPLSAMMPEDALGKLPKEITPETRLVDIKDPELFMQATDAFVRYHFGNDDFAGTGKKLEDNALMRGPDNKLKGTKGSVLEDGSEYDQTVSGIMHLAGKEKGKDENKGIDSRTNISAIFALGMGDCRHHAQVKQIMFDMWQKKQMDAALRTALTASKPQDRQAAMEEFGDIYLTELRSTDVRVNMEVQMEQGSNDKGETWDELYRPVLTPEGKFQKGDHVATLEEHTMTVLMKRTPEGYLDYFGLRDAFYQHTYEWGKQNIDPDKIKVVDGKPEINVGSLRSEEVATGEQIGISLTPTSYNSGKRDSSVKDSTGDDVCLLGIPMEGFGSAEEFAQMLAQRHYTEEMLKKALHWEKTYAGPEAKRKAEQKKKEKDAEKAGTPLPPKETPDYTAKHANNVSNALRLRGRSAEAEKIETMQLGKTVAQTQASEKSQRSTLLPTGRLQEGASR